MTGGIGALSMKHTRIPDAVIRRLPVYLRHLEQLRASGVDVVSSQELGDGLDANPAQIRKDLAYFGEFGRKGVGYDVAHLLTVISGILGLDRPHSVALVGAGHLGTALCHHNQRVNSPIRITHVFDADPAKIGQHIGGLQVLHERDLERVLREHNIRMAIIAVPADAAQAVADRLTAAGVCALLNFAPVSLRVPDGVHVRNADFTSELLSLVYYVARPATPV
jgi:redox-sensing transcriptional repressor